LGRVEIPEKMKKTLTPIVTYIFFTTLFLSGCTEEIARQHLEKSTRMMRLHQFMQEHYIKFDTKKRCFHQRINQENYCVEIKIVHLEKTPRGQ
jgi:hypothetical protein